jgi:ribose transport system substrate-binding protein
LSAFEESGRADQCFAIGLGADVTMRAELRRPGTRLIGAIAFFPEHYGDDLIRLALEILRRKPVPPAVYVRHRLVTAENIDHFYPTEMPIPVKKGQPP